MEMRRATVEELPELFRIQLEALGLAEMLTRLEPGLTPPFMRHGFEAGETLVAVDNGRLIGFAVGYARDGTWFLGEFFVLPSAQSTGAGRALLAAVMPPGLPSATVATRDHRALALYARAGMAPRWPVFELQADVERLKLQQPDIQIVEAASDASVLAWDARISGRHRPQDLRFLTESLDGSFFRLEREDRQFGYGGIARRGNGRIAVAPVGMERAVDACEAVVAMVAWAARQPGTQSITIDLPGPHPALPALLEGGFRISDLYTFCTSDATRFGDPQRYVPLSPALY